MQEFRTGWKVVFASMIGVAFGAQNIVFYTIGQFVTELSDAFDWSHASIQMIIPVIMLGMLVSLPAVGYLVDKYGARVITLCSIIVTSLLFMSYSLMPNNILVLYLISALIALTMGGVLPLTWTKIVSIWFDERRGLALGFTLLGVGLGASILKIVTAALIESIGWRGAYLVLGFIPLFVVLPLAWAWFKEPPTPAQNSSDQTTPLSDQGMTLIEALKSWQFWTVCVAFMPIGFVVTGLVTNMETILAAGGAPEATVIAAASTFGIFVIIGRVAGGYLLDQFNPAYVGGSLILLLSIACWMMAQQGLSEFGVFLAIALAGLGTGVEYDVMAYFVGRLFGLKNYTKIYAALFGIFSIAAAAGPVVYGLSYDQTGNFSIVLIGSAISIVIGSFLIALTAQSFKHAHAES